MVLCGEFIGVEAKEIGFRGKDQCPISNDQYSDAFISFLLMADRFSSLMAD